jgi:hypothetical protein
MSFDLRCIMSCAVLKVISESGQLCTMASVCLSSRMFGQLYHGIMMNSSYLAVSMVSKQLKLKSASISLQSGTNRKVALHVRLLCCGCDSTLIKQAIWTTCTSGYQCTSTLACWHAMCTVATLRCGFSLTEGCSVLAFTVCNI